MNPSAVSIDRIVIGVLVTNKVPMFIMDCVYLSLKFDLRKWFFFVWGFMSYLPYLCLFAHGSVRHILRFVFVLFFFVLCTLCCQFLLIAPSVFSNVYFLIVRATFVRYRWSQPILSIFLMAFDFFFMLPNILKYLTFKSFDLESTEWRLFQYHVMHTNLDIHVFSLYDFSYYMCTM